jgi:hypothetical protein
MSGFSAAWLASREAADHSARHARLTAQLLARLVPRAGPLQIVDLACGTGANLRYLAPLVRGPQHWLLVDNDPALLRAIPSRLASWCDERGLRLAWRQAGGRVTGGQLDCTIETRPCDLGAELETLNLGSYDLVTASALLDLVSQAWLERVANACRAAGSSALFALSFDGSVRFAPQEPDDAVVLGLVNEHQRRDKGFGPALGPSSTKRARETFERLGFDTCSADSPWDLGPHQLPLQAALLRGWADAAMEQRPPLTMLIEDWLGQRLTLLEAGRSQITVGHADLACWLA